jgi:hypothetical protein
MDIAAESLFENYAGCCGEERQRTGPKEPRPGGFRRKWSGDFIVSQSKIREGYGASQGLRFSFPKGNVRWRAKQSPSSRLVGGPFWTKQQ